MNTVDCNSNCCTSTPPVAVPGIEGVPGEGGANGQDGIPGYAFPFIIDSDTSSPPGDGNIKVNNAVFTSITQIFVSDFDRAGICITSTLNEIKRGDRLAIFQDSDHELFSSFAVSGAPSHSGTFCDPSAFFVFPVTPNTSTGPSGDVHLAIGPSGFSPSLDLDNGEQDGGGTDYSLTNAYAAIAFGTGQINVSLPSAGTYIVTAQISIDGATNGDALFFKFRNSTDASDIPGSEIEWDKGSNSGIEYAFLTSHITIAAAKTIQVWAVNSTAARGAINATYSKTTFLKVSNT